jgi:Alpha/beta hydrolase domain
MLHSRGMLNSRLPLAVLILSVTLLVPLSAKVLRVEVTSRADVLNGQSFGSAGAYEHLAGKVYFSVAVANPHNRRIVDLAHAVNLKNGEVAFSADFSTIRPKNAAKGNGSMILEIPNRGHGGIIRIVDGGDAALKDPGDAWLLRNGFTVVTLGWQWDAAAQDALRLYAPIAKEDGKAIRGLLRGDLMPSSPMPVIPLGHLITGQIGGTEYPVADPADARNVLTIRDSRGADRKVIQRSDWQFTDHRHIQLKSGFQPGKIYEYVYVVQDPVIAGLGFAAIRDYASYAKHSADTVTPAQWIYGEGISQNGRFLRDLLYQGFNSDEEGRMALDGVLAHVAGAGRGSFNYRFAQPSRDAQPTSSVDFPTDIFPFTDEPETDPLTGERSGLLDKAVAEKVVPKIFFSNTSYEYWGRAAALITTSADGKHDVALSPKVRVYKLTGLQHFSGPFPPAKGKGDLLGQQPESPLPIRYFWRAMIADMDAWVRNGAAPPPSSYPKLANGTLVPLEAYSFPAIRGLHQPHEASEAVRLDFGPHWQQGILSIEPPKVGPHFPVLVPQVDADGNETSGIMLPEIRFPLATYASWNLRDHSIGAPDQRVAFEDSYIPFPKTAEDRARTGDPRKSIAERYANGDEYMVHYTAALNDLVKERWILPEDRAALLERAKEEWILATR